MQIERNGTPSSFEDAPNGSVIFFRLRDETLLGLKTIERSGSHELIPRCLAIPHPDLDGRPGHYNADVVDGFPVLVIPDARLVPPRERRMWQPFPSDEQRPGDVLVTPTSALLVIVTPDNRFAVVDMVSGEVSRRPAPVATMLVRQWSIVRPHFDTQEIIYEHGKPASR